jgi:hypothetical protein
MNSEMAHPLKQASKQAHIPLYILDTNDVMIQPAEAPVVMLCVCGPYN